MPERLKPVLVLVLLVALDQESKLWAIELLTLLPPVQVIPGLLDLLLVYNRGASFGLLDTSAWGSVFLTLVAMVALVIFAHAFWTATDRLQQYSMTLLLAGVLGNLLDRLQQGQVTDFLHLHLGSFSLFVFNFADLLLTLGVLGWLWASWRPAR